MPDQRSLYEKVILDHNKSPRNYGEMENPDHKAEGYNALCGDQFTIFLKIGDNDVIDDIKFEGAGCAISKSSASVMTSMLKGKTQAEGKRRSRKRRRSRQGQTRLRSKMPRLA
ncbi:MAG TPA: iron-sulfur cluster assembly scaffold protein [Candidatus Hydrogenedentes bacterium]|nr:iron-sulfur cluster assembly scaffold protein [Candidatus Hydrogenedentota bacterium]